MRSFCMSFVCRYNGSVRFSEATSKNVGSKYAAMTKGFGRKYIYKYIYHLSSGSNNPLTLVMLCFSQDTWNGWVPGSLVYLPVLVSPDSNDVGPVSNCFIKKGICDSEDEVGWWLLNLIIRHEPQ
jgi:hypothetical protein